MSAVVRQDSLFLKTTAHATVYISVFVYPPCIIHESCTEESDEEFILSLPSVIIVLAGYIEHILITYKNV